MDHTSQEATSPTSQASSPTSQATSPMENITPTDEGTRAHIMYASSLDQVCLAGQQDVAEGRELLEEVSRKSGTDIVMSDETAAKKRPAPGETDDDCDPFASDNLYGSQAE